MSTNKLREIVYDSCDNHEFIGFSFEKPDKLHLWYYHFIRDHGAGGAVCNAPYSKIFDKSMPEKDFKYIYKFHERFLKRKVEEAQATGFYHL